jgi:uncharacterized membrane protein (DUF485 family)
MLYEIFLYVLLPVLVAFSPIFLWLAADEIYVHKNIAVAIFMGIVIAAMIIAAAVYFAKRDHGEGATSHLRSSITRFLT